MMRGDQHDHNCLHVAGQSHMARFVHKPGTLCVPSPAAADSGILETRTAGSFPQCGIRTTLDVTVNRSPSETMANFVPLLSHQRRTNSRTKPTKKRRVRAEIIQLLQSRGSSRLIQRRFCDCIKSFIACRRSSLLQDTGDQDEGGAPLSIQLASMNFCRATSYPCVIRHSISSGEKRSRSVRILLISA